MANDLQFRYRDENYETLFNGENLYNSDQDVSLLSIAGLCRSTIRSGMRSKKLNDHLDQIPSTINDILTEHDQAAIAQSNAAYAFINDQARVTVRDIVAKVFTQWEIAMTRKNYETLLPGKDDSSKWLVVETAAAVMQVIGDVPQYKIETYSKDADRIAAIIASWGPKFAKQWFDTTILTQWMNGLGISDTEQSQWLEVFTPGVLKRIAEYHTTNPINALNRIKNNLDTYLTEEAIAAQLAWQLEEVRAVFSPSVRKHFAVSNISNPQQAIKKVKDNLEVHLSSANIAKITGWSEDLVRDTFSPYILRRIAVHQINNPITAIRKIKDNLEIHLTDASIAEATGWSEDQVRVMFVESMRIFLATWYINNPLHGVTEWAKGKIKIGGAIEYCKSSKMLQLGL